MVSSSRVESAIALRFAERRRHHHVARALFSALVLAFVLIPSAGADDDGGGAVLGALLTASGASPMDESLQIQAPQQAVDLQPKVFNTVVALQLDGGESETDDGGISNALELLRDVHDEQQAIQQHPEADLINARLAAEAARNSGGADAKESSLLSVVPAESVPEDDMAANPPINLGAVPLEVLSPDATSPIDNLLSWNASPSPLPPQKIATLQVSSQKPASSKSSSAAEAPAQSPALDDKKTVTQVFMQRQREKAFFSSLSDEAARAAARPSIYQVYIDRKKEIESGPASVFADQAARLGVQGNTRRTETSSAVNEAVKDQTMLLENQRVDEELVADAQRDGDGDASWAAPVSTTEPPDVATVDRLYQTDNRPSVFEVYKADLATTGGRMPGNAVTSLYKTRIQQLEAASAARDAMPQAPPRAALSTLQVTPDVFKAAVAAGITAPADPMETALRPSGQDFFSIYRQKLQRASHEAFLQQQAGASAASQTQSRFNAFLDRGAVAQTPPVEAPQSQQEQLQRARLWQVYQQQLSRSNMEPLNSRPQSLLARRYQSRMDQLLQATTPASPDPDDVNAQATQDEMLAERRQAELASRPIQLQPPLPHASSIFSAYKRNLAKLWQPPSTNNYLQQRMVQMQRKNQMQQQQQQQQQQQRQQQYFQSRGIGNWAEGAEARQEELPPLQVPEPLWQRPAQSSPVTSPVYSATDPRFGMRAEAAAVTAALKNPEQARLFDAYRSRLAKSGDAPVQSGMYRTYLSRLNGPATPAVPISTQEAPASQSSPDRSAQMKGDSTHLPSFQASGFFSNSEARYTAEPQADSSMYEGNAARASSLQWRERIATFQPPDASSGGGFQWSERRAAFQPRAPVWAPSLEQQQEEQQEMDQRQQRWQQQQQQQQQQEQQREIQLQQQQQQQLHQHVEHQGEAAAIAAALRDRRPMALFKTYRSRLADLGQSTSPNGALYRRYIAGAGGPAEDSPETASQQFMHVSALQEPLVGNSAERFQSLQRSRQELEGSMQRGVQLASRPPKPAASQGIFGSPPIMEVL